MRLLKKIPMMLFIAINLLMMMAMIFCAYTSTLPPQEHPHVSYMGLMFPVFAAANALFIPFWLIFKWKLAILPLIGMLICIESVRAYFPLNLPTDPPEGCIKVLSYNVMGFGEKKGPAWEENEILLYIKKSNADIVCLQEVTNSNVDKALATLSNEYPYVSIEKQPKSYMACLSKFPIDSVQHIHYTSDNNFSYAYHILLDDDTLLLINNHLESYKLSPEDKEDYKSIIENYQHPDKNNSETKYLSLVEKLSSHDSIRGEQVDSVADFIARNHDKSIILCGDLNSSPISYTHHRLTEYLNDAYTRSGNGPGLSYNRSGMYFRIDHIMTSPNFTAYGAKVDQSFKESDHYPIFCFVKRNKNNEISTAK